MKCPRCQSSITAAPDPDGFLICPGCGARLRSRSAPATVGALNARGTRTPLAEGSSDEILGVLTRLDPDAERFPDAVNPNSTLPPGTPLPRIPRPGSPEAQAALADAPPRPAPALRPAADPAPRVMRAPRDVPREAGDEAARPGAKVPGATIEGLMEEIKALRHLQEETLALLRSGALAPPDPSTIDVAFELGLPSPPAVRARRRKKVLLIDDDRETRRATEEVLDAAEIPLRVVSDGRSALAAIAEDKPDVVVMELDIAGPMAGRDVIKKIKTTTSWVDIPIILYTRAPIVSQREARTVHGADDFVSKQDGPEPLLARVVTLFRRG
jgi:CheY-like chemotaxis protein